MSIISMLLFSVIARISGNMGARSGLLEHSKYGQEREPHRINRDLESTNHYQGRSIEHSFGSQNVFAR